MAGNHHALTPELIAKECRAAELREAGYEYAAIAEKVGYADASGAHRAVQRVLKRARREKGDELLALELRRLDAMHAGLWDRARRGDTFSVDRVLKIQERRSAYLGLDAPAKHALTDPSGQYEYGRLTDEQLEREIAVAVARVRGARGTAPGPAGAGAEVPLDAARPEGTAAAGG